MGEVSVGQTAVESRRRRPKKLGHNPGFLVAVTQNVSRFRLCPSPEADRDSR